jgi:hypothetical protein
VFSPNSSAFIAPMFAVVSREISHLRRAPHPGQKSARVPKLVPVYLRSLCPLAAGDVGTFLPTEMPRHESSREQSMCLVHVQSQTGEQCLFVCCSQQHDVAPSLSPNRLPFLGVFLPVTGVYTYFRVVGFVPAIALRYLLSLGFRHRGTSSEYWVDWITAPAPLSRASKRTGPSRPRRD